MSYPMSAYDIHIYEHRARYSCLRCRVRYPVIHDVEFYYVVPDIVPDIAPDVFYIGIYGDRARYRRSRYRELHDIVFHAIV